MNPAAQKYAAQYPERAYQSEISVTKVKLAFGEQVLKVWLMAQLENLNDFAGVKAKMNLEQMEELANIISIDYGYLRAAEILLFFHLFKKGQYGQLYGSVDPQLIAAALFQYTKDRQVSIARIEAENNRRQLDLQRAEWAKNGITREEFERRKSAKPKNTSY